MARVLSFLKDLERSPAGIDELDDAVAGRHVPIRSALRTQTATVLAAQGLHRDRDLDTLFDDRGDGHDRVVVEIRIELVLGERKLSLGDRRTLVEKERKVLVVREVVRRQTATALELPLPGEPGGERVAALDAHDLSRDAGRGDVEERFAAELFGRERDLELEPQGLVDDGFEREVRRGVHGRTGHSSDSGRRVKPLIP